MRTKLLLPALLGLAVLSLPTNATAQTIKSRTRNTVETKAADNAAKNISALQSVRKAAVPTVRHDAIDPTTYGEVDTIITEDFALMTAGAIGAPATDTIITYDNPDNVWITMSDGYTHESGWGGHNIYQAGGCVAVFGDYGNFNTPMLDVSRNEGVAFLRFKARTDDKHPTDGLHIEGAETFNMSPSWRVLEYYEIQDLSTEWKEYTFMFHNGGEYTLFNFYPYHATSTGNDTVAVYIDDVEVLQAVPTVAMPEGLGHRNYQGSTFDIYWQKVADADSYLVNLYHETAASGYHQNAVRDTVLSAESVSDTVYTVENAVSGDDYYFTVRAVKGTAKSFETTEEQVCDLVSPVPETTGLADSANTYHVTWDAVPSAEVYNYWAYALDTAKVDGEFAVTDENFDNAVCPAESFNDYFTEDDWKNINSDTPGSDNYYSLSSYVVNVASQPGWIAYNGMPMSDGCIKVDGYQYVYNHSDAGLVSPELDLSKDGGNITISADLKAQTGRVWFDDNTYETRTTQCAVALFNWDEQKGDYTQSELQVISNLDGTWTNHTVNFTTGTDRSVVGLYAIYAPENLFIDNVKITQNYTAGETFQNPVFFRHYYSGTSLDVTLPANANGKDISHRMTSTKQNTATYAIVDSKLPELTAVGHAVFNGIQKVSMVNADVQFDGNNIITSGDALVYTIDGRLAAKVKAAGGRAQVNLPSGAYIVRTGGKSVKVVF